MTQMRYHAALDVHCPRCQAEAGQVCVSGGGHGKRKGEPCDNPHAARAAMLPPKVIECGTYAGFQLHKRSDEKPCEPCRLARNEWVAQYRHTTHRANYSNEKRKNAARNRALWRLAKAHPEEFRAYVEEERKA